jgi:hypothetical protein
MNSMAKNAENIPLNYLFKLWTVRKCELLNRVIVNMLYFYHLNDSGEGGFEGDKEKAKKKKDKNPIV